MQAQVSGKVFRDFNSDGTLDNTQTRLEFGVSGVTVTATLAGGGVVTTTTSTSGTYAFTPTQIPAGTQVLLEFSGLPTGDYSTAMGSNNASAVQFVTGGTSTTAASFALNTPLDYCQTDPRFTVVCFARNNDVASEPVIIDMAYSLGRTMTPIDATDVDKDWASPSGATTTNYPVVKNNVADQGAVGTVFGTAWDRFHKQVLSGTFVRAYSAIKTNSSANGFAEGAIYRTTYANGVATGTALWLDLETLFGNDIAGTYVADAVYPGPTVYGITGTNPNPIGYTGLGAMSVSRDGGEVYVVNLHTQEIFVIPINADGTAETNTATIKRFPFPASDCASGNWSYSKPYRAVLGLGVHPVTGRVYATLTCNGPTAADLKGIVYSFDPADASPAATDFTKEFEIPLDLKYPATNVNFSNVWYSQIVHPWESVTPAAQVYTNDVSNNSQHTQPWLGEVEFDLQPSGTYGMIVGVRNRFHDQINGSFYVAGGAMFRACNTGTNAAPVWSLESDASTADAQKAICDDYTSVVNWSFTSGRAGFNTSSENRFFKYVGREGTMLSGTSDTWPGFLEVIAPAQDNVFNLSTSGITWLTTADGDRSRDARVLGDFTNTGFNNTNFTKANNWGSISMMCNLPPVEIGNRVWLDKNKDGIQGPDENPIAGVTVQLFAVGGTTPIATDVTDANGNYIFSSVSTTAITTNTAYEVRIPVVQTALTSLSFTTPNTGANDGIDSDFAPGVATATLSLTTGDIGQNIHTYDAGLICDPPVLATLTSQSICQGGSFALPLSASVTSGTATGYQWYITDATGTSFTIISGATSRTFTPAGANLPAVSGGIKYYAISAYNSNTACSDMAFASLSIKPTQTITFTAPSVAAVTQCANTTMNLSVTTNAKAPDAIKFVYFTSPLASPASAYTATGGTVLGTVNSGTLATNTVSLSNVQLPDLVGSTPMSLTVYAILQSTDGLCLPVDQFTLTLNPRPAVVIGGSTVICQGTTAVLNAGGPAGTTYQWFLNNSTTVVSAADPYTTPAISTTTTYRLRGTLATCVSDDASIVLTPVVCTPCAASPTALGGKVYQDFSSNGTQDAADPGMQGVTVTIFSCDATGTSTQVAQIPTDINGAYSFTGLTAGTTYRVEFSNFPAGYEPTFQGAQNGTTAQFTKPGSCSVSLGLNQPGDYCQTTVRLITPCYVNGSVTGAGPVDALVGFDYNFTNEVHLATKAQIGSTWGVAYNKYNKLLYTAAFLKRHVGMGPGGLGAIYVTNPNAGAANGTLLFDIGTVDNVGASQITLTDGSRGLTTPVAASHDNQAAALIAKVGLGDLDISTDGAYLYTVSLASKKLWRVPTNAPTAANVTSWAIPNLPNWDLAKGDYRPFALKVVKDKVYIGVTFDAEISQQKADLAASIYELDPATGVFSQVYTFPMSYVHGDANGGINDNGFYPWLTAPTDNLLGGYILYPQPVFSDIEFDSDGTMVLGFFDRSGHQFGADNFKVNSNATATVQVGGELLRLGRNPADLTQYQLENNGIFYDQTGALFIGAANNQGPGGGEFYSGETFASHQETSVGGLAIKPGSGEIVLTSMDPAALFYNGYIALSQTTGAKLRSVNITTEFDKGNGLGDVDLACDLAPIQIGNRVWRDDNQNGIQDPCEPAIPGAVVKLYDATKTTVIASATTNAAGEYYFSSTTVVAGTSTSSVSTSLLTYNTNYALVITSLGTSSVVGALSLTDVSPLTPGESSTVNSGSTINNNDAIVDAGKPCIKLTTGGPGEVNHTYDSGIVKPPCGLTLTAQVSSLTICQNQSVQLTATASTTGTGALTYAWCQPAGVDVIDPNSATATAMNFTTTGPKVFTVVVTSPTCSTTASVTVTVAPSLNLYLTQKLCSADASTYAIRFVTTPVGAVVTSSAGTVSGTSVTGIPANAPFSLTATLNGCQVVLNPILPACTPTAPACNSTAGNLGGSVFRDFNIDGTKATSETLTFGEVLVTLTDCTGNSFTTLTDNSGRYTFAQSITYPVRVDFGNLPAGFESTFTGSNNGTTAQFIPAATCNASIGLSRPADYCGTNPRLATPCYIDGASSASANTTGLGDVLVSLSYNTLGVSLPQNKTTDGARADIGSTWGLAYSRQTNDLYAASFLKRHVGLKDGKLGVIYVKDYDNPTGAMVPWLDVSTLPGLTGNWQFLTDAQRGLGNAGVATADPEAFSNVAAIGLGDIDISDDGKTLYAMDLTNRQLLAIDVATKTLIGKYPVPEVCTGTAGPMYYSASSTSPTAGGKAWRKGIVFDSDNNALEYAQTITNPNNLALGTTDASLYATSVYTSTSLVYNFPIGNGNYSVKMHFATNGTTTNRNTDVTAESTTVVSGLDVYAQSGNQINMALTRSFTATVTDNVLTIKLFNRAPSALMAVSGFEIVPLTAKPVGVTRPFATKFRDGKVYVGAVCDASYSQNVNDLTASVFEFNPASGTYAANPVLTIPLNYVKGGGAGASNNSWEPWTSVYPNNTDAGIRFLFVEYFDVYAQPVLSDIEFDDDGSMIVGFFDRFGHQTSGALNNKRPDGTLSYHSVANGDLLRAYYNGTSYELEYNGKEGASSCKPLSAATGNNQGPGGGEFYKDELTGLHYEISLGGIAILPGSGEVRITAADPLAAYSGGIADFSNTTGDKIPGNSVTLYSGVGGGVQNKASGLGDLELICAPGPIQIGNRVWRDDDQDGIQDPCEPPIAGAVVNLYDATKTTLIASATTNAAGEYYFSSTTVVGGTSTSSVSTTALKPNTPYALVVSSLGTGTVASGLSITNVTPLTPGESGSVNSGTTTTNNDANLIAGQPWIELITGDPGTSNHTYDFGFTTATAGLGDYVFEDKNINGIQDAGDVPIPGVVVTLYKNGSAVATTTTDASGAYSFTGLTPGTSNSYVVGFAQPVGYVPTVANAGTDALDSDASVVTGLTGTYSLTASEFNPTVDAGFYKPASLGNYVFDDKNKDGIQDAGDSPIPGVVVTLYQNGSAVATTTTDANGLYSFTGLTPGTSNSYVVGFTAPAGYSATSPLSGTDATKDSNADPITGLTQAVTLASGENNPTIDAGFYQPTASLGDYVFQDVNANGQQDAGDTPISGVVITLYQNGSAVATTTTDVNGLYSFTGLTPGASNSYVVGFTAPAGFTATIPNSGTDATDSDGNPITGLTGTYILAPGENNPTVDMGYVLACKPVCVPISVRKTR